MCCQLNKRDSNGNNDPVKDGCWCAHAYGRTEGQTDVITAYPTFITQADINITSGPVVECLNRDRGVAGSSRTGGTALCP